VTERDYATLHEATLRLLERTGVRVESALALGLLADHGVRIDLESQRAYVAEEQVRWALASAPRSYCLYGRSGGKPLEIGGDNTYALAGGGLVRVLTLDGRYEPATWEHLRRFNTLLDALPNIHMLLNEVDPEEDAGEGYYRRIAAEMFLGTSKPILFQAGDASDVAAMVAMGTAVRGSRQALRERPLFQTGGNAEPPLCIPGHVAEIQIAAGREDIACGTGDYVMMGITGPSTVAGAAVEVNAVQLTTLVLSQAARQGAPFAYTSFSGGGNMRTLDPLTCTPQAIKLARLTTALGRWYGVPVYGAAMTDAKMADPQAACERTLQLQVAVEAGCNIVQSPTSHMDQMMLSSYAQAVIDDEIVGYVLATRGDPEINDETLALDVMHEVVSDPSLASLKYAAHPHTAAHFREGLWTPTAFVYDAFPAWQAAGAPTVLERAEARARDLLARHRPEPLPPTVEWAVREIAARGA